MRAALCLVALIVSVLATSVEECRAKGFTEMLQCASCDKLEQLVSDEDLRSDCRACCQKERADSDKIKYDNAELEVDQWMVQRFPEVKDFIEKRAGNYPNLAITYKRGAQPVIRFKDSKGRKQEEISLASWKIDVIADFLNTKLVKD